MKAYRTTRIMSLVVLMATTGTLMLVLSTTVHAQRNPIDIFNARRAEERAEAIRRRELEQIRQTERRPFPPDQRQRAMLIAQIREDFNLIQLLNKEMIRECFDSRLPDYVSLSEKAADIKRRATRLSTTIKFADVKDERKSQRNQDELDREQFKSSLLVLGTLITKFVTNPFFQKPGVIDVQQSARASADLRDIIELSDLIRKNAKKLDKASR